MGVLYHQKNHLLHLQQLKTVLAEDGELILETLIIDEKQGEQIIPQDRLKRK
jgi:tRNA (mo5U34)-methyltransferase